MKLALAALALVGSTLASADPGPLTVSVRELAGCSHALPWTKSSEVRETRRDGTDLVVGVLANATCGGMRAESPRAEARDKEIEITWLWVNPDNAPLAACKCTRHLEFRVADAPEGDVAIRAAARAK
jgi:hypothetical protein